MVGLKTIQHKGRTGIGIEKAAPIKGCMAWEPWGWVVRGPDLPNGSAAMGRDASI